MFSLVDRRYLSSLDWQLLTLVLLLLGIGLTVLHSAGYSNDLPAFSEIGGVAIRFSRPLQKQFIFILAGSLVIAAAALIPPRLLQKLGYGAYSIALALTAAVLVIGVVANGSRRWLHLGPVNFQPAELMKICLVLAMARLLSSYPPPKGGYGFRQLVVPFLLFLLPMGLIVRQPDLGTALVVGATGFAMVLFLGIQWKALLCMFLAGLASLYPAWHLLEPYQQRRVLALVNPGTDALGSGYHIIQSTIAVGSGGALGKGYLQGTQAQLHFIPEHTTDFIFSVLAEEWGFVGAAIVLVLYFLPERR